VKSNNRNLKSVSTLLVNSFIDKINQHLLSNEAEILRNILVLLSKDVESGSEVAEKILKVVEDDLENNKNLPNNFIAKDLEIINNLISNPIISKDLLNSATLMPNLTRIYLEKNNDNEIKGLIGQILSKLTANDSNNDAIIHSHPKILTLLNKDLMEKTFNLKDPLERKTLASGIDAYIQVLTNNSKVLNDKGIITTNDIDVVVKKFASDEEFGEKLLKIQNLLNSINKEKQALENLNKDVSFFYYYL